MSSTFNFNLSELVPARKDVFHHQGIPPGSSIPTTVNTLYQEALELFMDFVQPIGLLKEVTKSEFKFIFKGQGKNESDNPVKNIFPQADFLALFTLTLGRKVSEKIKNLFDDYDFALGSMLDTVASVVAEQATLVLEEKFYNILEKRGRLLKDGTVLSYSPGYCGWDIGGQEALFQWLQPGQIGVTLNQSFLMNPLKSVSGVLIAGKTDIHRFKSNFPFCKSCLTFSCRDRINVLEKDLNTEDR